MKMEGKKERKRYRGRGELGGSNGVKEGKIIYLLTNKEGS